MIDSLRPIDIVYIGAQMQAAYVSFWEAYEAYQEELQKSGPNTPRTLTKQAAAHKERVKFVEYRKQYLSATAQLPM